MLDDYSCETCKHKNVCKLRETREKLDEKLKDIHIEENSKIYVISKCDEYIKEYDSIAIPYRPITSTDMIIKTTDDYLTNTICVPN